MSEKRIEYYIDEVLTGDTKKRALEFVTYLRESDMFFERYNKGYWEDKLYWSVKYNGEVVFHILIKGSEDNVQPWIIWTDNSNDSGSNWFADFPLDEYTKEIAWKYVDICGKCGYCSGGKRKTIFGKEFNDVCGTTMRFDNPNIEALECVKKIANIRKNEISKNIKHA